MKTIEVERYFSLSLLIDSHMIRSLVVSRPMSGIEILTTVDSFIGIAKELAQGKHDCYCASSKKLLCRTPMRADYKDLTTTWYFFVDRIRLLIPPRGLVCSPGIIDNKSPASVRLLT